MFGEQKQGVDDREKRNNGRIAGKSITYKGADLQLMETLPWSGCIPEKPMDPPIFGHKGCGIFSRGYESDDSRGAVGTRTGCDTEVHTLLMVGHT